MADEAVCRTDACGGPKTQQLPGTTGILSGTADISTIPYGYYYTTSESGLVSGIAVNPSSWNITFGSDVGSWFVIAGSTKSDGRGSAITIFPDGSIKFGPKFKGKRDARRFWVELAKAYPSIVPKVAGEKR